ncbi:hypothetical protein [Coprobacter fastidiosus]|uniref:hypothetical protein n=1 Tax=Coprobacter fastidiosus TaxID=1099853 RepID=UPI00266F3EA7|nr:hypothetical protein [Coprobacter fastidiosus]
MMKNQEEKKEKQSEDLVSLNDSLYNEFSLEELENCTAPQKLDTKLLGCFL